MTTKEEYSRALKTAAIALGWITLIAVNYTAGYELRLIVLTVAPEAHLPALLFGVVFFTATLIADVAGKVPRSNFNKIENILNFIVPAKAALQSILMVGGLGLGGGHVIADESLTQVALHAFKRDPAAVVILFLVLWGIDVLAKALVVEHEEKEDIPNVEDLFRSGYVEIGSGGVKTFYFHANPINENHCIVITYLIRGGFGDNASLVITSLEQGESVIRTGVIKLSGEYRTSIVGGRHRIDIYGSGWLCSRHVNITITRLKFFGQDLTKN